MRLKKHTAYFLMRKEKVKVRIMVWFISTEKANVKK